MKAKDRATKIVRSLRSGQITIPAEFRKRLGITKETLLQLTLEQDELRIRTLRMADQGKSSRWLEELYDYFAPAVRRQRSTARRRSAPISIGR